ncbi:hypothetical protein KAU33_02150, partial [Candidatus Dependentiae bacterium]|nr:hypothetical protein [Candidatus Dependentiae bacterium]
MKLGKFWLTPGKYSAFRMCPSKFKRAYLSGKKSEYVPRPGFNLNKFLTGNYLEYHQKSKGLFFKAPNFIKGLKNRLGDENLSEEERKPIEELIEGYITELENTKPKLLENDKSMFYKSKEVNIVLHFDLYLQYKDGKKSIVVFKTTNNYNIPENLYNDFEPQLYKYVLDDNGEYPADYLEFFYLKFNKFIRLEFSKINKEEAYSSIKQMFDAIDS